jgi:arylsulfatase A-like enzyme
VIVILADDLGYGDVGTYGSSRVHTPNIDSLARDGITFSAGYVAAAVCSPSRAALMTGRYPQRFGYHFNDNSRPGLPVTERVLAQRFAEAGYATSLIGKWQLGMGDGYHPLDRGFNEFYGMTSGSIFIEPDAPGVENWSPQSLPKTRQRPIFRDREIVHEDAYLTDAFSREALDFIDRHAEQPFFLFLSHYAPHVPLQATKQYLDRYRHIKELGPRVLAAMVSAVDDSVGLIEERLHKHGIENNTLIFFLSDNGCALYTNGACTNYPLNGGKRYHHEGGVRVPFIMKWPERVDAGRTYDKPVSAMDILPTALVAADLKAHDGNLDGTDLLPFVTGENDGAPHERLFWRVGPNQAVREGNWKLWNVNRADPVLAKTAVPTGLLADWTAPKGAPRGQLTLLYDLANDLAEEKNIAAEHPEVVARLQAALAAWSRNLPEPSTVSTRGTITTIDGEAVQLIF